MGCYDSDGPGHAPRYLDVSRNFVIMNEVQLRYLELISARSGINTKVTVTMNLSGDSKVVYVQVGDKCIASIRALAEYLHGLAKGTSDTSVKLINRKLVFSNYKSSSDGIAFDFVSLYG